MANFLETGWKNALSEEFKKPYVDKLFSFVKAEYQSGQEIFPQRELVFNALQQTPYHQVKVVIVGQDPYHGPGQAHGLSFSVRPGIPLPPSLKNIFKEVAQDVGPFQPNSGSLLGWSKQGVLLLNAILTVKRGQPASHQGRGWEELTDAILRVLAERKERVVFLLWGKYAEQKGAKIADLVKTHGHVVLVAAHPSPFSAANGFFGCRHFSLANKALIEVGIQPIDWHALI